MARYFRFLALLFFTACSGQSTVTESGTALNSGPVDIPITISKTIEGIDPASIVYRPTRTEILTIGQLRGQLINTSDEADIFAYQDGVLLYTTRTEDGVFTFDDIPAPLTLALAAVNEAGTKASYPVIVILDENGNLEVAFTNISGIVPNARMGVYPDGRLAFCMQDGSSYSLAETTMRGGYPETITTGLSACPALYGRTENNVVGLSDGNVTLYGETTTILGTTTLADPYVRIQKDTDEIAFLSDENTVVTQTWGADVCPVDGADVVSQIFDFVDEDTLLAYQLLADGTYRAEMVDLNLGEEGHTPQAFDKSCSDLQCGSASHCLLACENGDKNNLYSYTPNDSFTGPHVTENVAGFDFCSATSILLETDPTDLNCSSRIMQTDPLDYILNDSGWSGCDVHCDRSNDRIAHYFCEVDGQPQICLHNFAGGTSTMLSLDGPEGFFVGECTGFRVEVTDYLGSTTDLSSQTTFGLSALLGNFYSDSNCSSSVTSVSLTEEATFYYKASSDGDETITVTSTSEDITGDRMNALVEDAAVALVLSGQPAGSVGNCTDALSIGAQDSNGSYTHVRSGGENVDVTVSLSGAGNGFFYSDAACTTAMTAITLEADASNPVKNFYFKDNTAEALTFNAAATGLETGTLSFTVN